MNLQNLRSSLEKIMPILDANLSAAHNEYMDCKISAGAYRVVRQRHENALVVLSDNSIHPEVAYKACAALAIDLGSGVKDMPNKEAAKTAVEDWWQCYRDAGFSEIHRFFDIPALPDDAPSTLPSPDEVKAALIGHIPRGACITHITPLWGGVLEPGERAIEVFKHGHLGDKALTIEVTPQRLYDLIRSGLVELESTSGNDPELSCRYDHYRVV